MARKAEMQSEYLIFCNILCLSIVHNDIITLQKLHNVFVIFDINYNYQGINVELSFFKKFQRKPNFFGVTMAKTKKIQAP